MALKTLDEWKTPRLKTLQARDKMLKSAYEFAKEHGYANLTRLAISEHMGVGATNVNYYFTSMNNLKRRVMELAVRDSDLAIIACGLQENCEIAKSAPIELKRKAAELIYI